MAIIAGIDEAGYGPILGPLTVSGVAFRVPDDQADGCLWERLQASVTRSASRRDRRLPIIDSKKLYSRQAGLDGLERTSLTALRVSGHNPASLRDLLQVVSPDVPAQLDEYPWYCDFDVGLPLAVDAARIATQANALGRDCRNHGIDIAGFFCEPLLEGHFNRLVSRTRNKGVVLLGLVLRIVDRFMKLADGRPLHIFVDRQGGRARYATHLMTAFEGCDLQIVEESADRSAYVLRRANADVRIAFVVSGEDKHLPIALASILSKYLRELLMMGLNRYWQAHVPGLRPTAGYYTDGHRFLKDIAAAVQRTGVDRSLLVRSR